MTAEAVNLRWCASCGAITAEGYIHTYAVTKQGRYWTAAMKYTAIHGNDHWEAVPGPFPLTRRQGMANAEIHEVEICAASASRLEARPCSKATPVGHASTGTPRWFRNQRAVRDRRGRKSSAR
jgi:hypothetical protein